MRAANQPHQHAHHHTPPRPTPRRSFLSIAALHKGLYEVVAASLLGSILSNLLLVLGERRRRCRGAGRGGSGPVPGPSPRQTTRVSAAVSISLRLPACLPYLRRPSPGTCFLFGGMKYKEQRFRCGGGAASVAWHMPVAVLRPTPHNAQSAAITPALLKPLTPVPSPLSLPVVLWQIKWPPACSSWPA